MRSSRVVPTTCEEPATTSSNSASDGLESSRSSQSQGRDAPAECGPTALQRLQSSVGRTLSTSQRGRDAAGRTSQSWDPGRAWSPQGSFVDATDQLRTSSADHLLPNTSAVPSNAAVSNSEGVPKPPPSIADLRQFSSTRFSPTTSATKRAKGRLLTLRSHFSRRTGSGDSSAAGSLTLISGRDSRQGSNTSIFDLLNRNDDPAWKRRLGLFLESIQVTLVVTVVTFVALFLDDLRLACFPPALDVPCEAVAGIVMVVFFLELCCASLARAKYFLRFYFWIDLVATLSMAMDMPALVHAVTGEATGAAGPPALSRQPANQVEARVRAIVRVTRILRLMRVVKLFQLYQAEKENAKFERQNGIRSKRKVPWWQSSGGSRVGQRLSDLTSQRVILGIFLLLLFIPGFNIKGSVYGDAPVINVGGLAMLQDIYTTEGPSPAWAAARDTYGLLMESTGQILNLIVNNVTYVFNPVGATYRTVELLIVRTSMGCGGAPGPLCVQSVAIFNAKWPSQFGAALNLLRTAFIVGVLAAGVYLLNRDSARLVLRPIERMLSKVREVSENPLSVKAGRFGHERRNADTGMETRILEASISKILSLLAVGFGDAGAEVIADNIKSGGDLNPMVPGQHIVAIFGFCDIRNFTDATEVLQEEVMEFVNSIAKIVHMEVSLHGGAPNKNVGDAFLLVWKFPKSFSVRDLRRLKYEGHTHSLAKQPVPYLNIMASCSLELEQPEPSALSTGAPKKRLSIVAPGQDLSPDQLNMQARELADKALAAFIVIQAALKRSQRLAQYVARADLNARMPGFQVRLGFGLHVGWAIEGAIGSEYKIDASYLSPNVNMASRLEAATKQFGVALLLSEDFARMLSPGVAQRVRQIDTVTVKGSQTPLGLFTYDTTLERVMAPPPTGPPVLARGGSGFKEGDHPGHVATFSMQAYDNEFLEHPDIRATWAVDEVFLARFAQGFEAYRHGNWQTARTVLEETRETRRTMDGTIVIDGPSAALLEYMRGHGFEAPATWKGYRELTEK